VTSPAAGPSHSSSTVQADASATLVDPLSEITDNVAKSIRPILHADGLGPAHYDLRLDAETHSVRVYVVCTPDSPYTVATGKRFSGECTTRFQAFADIPVQAPPEVMSTLK